MKPAVLLAFSVISASAQVINIDTFNDGDFSLSLGTTGEHAYTGTSMIGGERRVLPQGNAVSVGNGVLTLDRVGIFGGPADFLYGSLVPGDSTRHLHLDGSAYPGFLLTVSAADNPFEVVLGLYSTDNGATQTSLAFFHVTSPRQYVATYPSGTVNVANISGFSLEAPTGNEQGLFKIDAFALTTAVPEPSAWSAALGVTAAAVVLFRRTHS